MNQKTIKLVQSELKRLEIEGVISKKRAMEIDELTEGYLFENVMKNAYTEHPSIQQYDLTMKVLMDYIGGEKRYSKEESLKIIDAAISAVERIDELTDIEVNDIIIDALMSDMIKLGMGDKIIPFRELEIKDIPDVLDQLEDLVDSREDRIFMNVFNHMSTLKEQYDHSTLLHVIQFGIGQIRYKSYQSTLDNMRDNFIAHDSISSHDIGYLFQYPEAGIAAIEVARLFLTRLREDIITRYKEEHDIT